MNILFVVCLKLTENDFFQQQIMNAATQNNSRETPALSNSTAENR